MRLHHRLSEYLFRLLINILVLKDIDYFYYFGEFQQDLQYALLLYILLNQNQFYFYIYLVLIWLQLEL